MMDFETFIKEINIFNFGVVSFNHNRSTKRGIKNEI